MRIWIDTYQLADEHTEGVSNFYSRPRRNLEIREGVRRAHIGLVDRANQRMQHSFNIKRTHADAASAEIYMLDHPADVPAQGVLKFEFTFPDGTKAYRWIVAAAIEAMTVSYSGCLTHHSYTIIGSELLKVDPGHAN